MIAGAMTLPANFETMIFEPESQATVTLVDGASLAGPLLIGGNGTIVNSTNLSDPSQVVISAPWLGSYGYPSFVNNGTIRTTAGTADRYAVHLFSANRFENNGIIAATGSGIYFSAQGLFANTGQITAVDTAVSLFGRGFDNSGTIRSTGGTAAVLFGSSGPDWVNSGLIEGAQIGADLQGWLINTGTITSPDTGVLLQVNSTLDNRAGGVVSGGLAAVRSADALFNADVINAGAIDGDVVFGGQPNPYRNNRYFALPGGVLNGNLTLGQADTLITELTNTGPGAFAGITGTVTASESLLRYRVRQNAGVTLGAPDGFASVGYDLYDNAQLTLTGTLSQTLTIAGVGSVDLTADGTSSNGQPLISVTPPIFTPGENPTASALSIISHGALVLEHGDDAPYLYAAITIGSEDSFTNTGTITVRERPSTFFSLPSAIAGGKNVANTGTIILSGTNGVSGASEFTNSGAILQEADGGVSTGVRNIGRLINSGRIDVAGNAVASEFFATTITNSGRLASSGTAAIAGSAFGLMITNQVSGQISGGPEQPAIQLARAMLDNAGTITGSVDLGYTSFGRAYASSTYIANGGTITGDLRFGDYIDTMIVLNGKIGVSGAVDGGGGDDILIHARDTSGTVTLDLNGVENFERIGVRTLGAGTIVTAIAPALVESDIYLSGDGHIVSTATIDGAVRASRYDYALGDTAEELILGSFTNQGDIRGGFFGATHGFANSGTIGTSDTGGNAVSIITLGDLNFDNSGNITGEGNIPAVSLLASDGDVAANNSGQLQGGLTASVTHSWTGLEGAGTPLSLSLANSGTLSSANEAVKLSFQSFYPANGGVLLVNSGTIEASGQNGTGAILAMQANRDPATPSYLTVENSGTIRANVGGTEQIFDDGWGNTYRYTRPANALVFIGSNGSVTVNNGATGVIEATGERSSAITVLDGDLVLNNAGTIRGGAGTTLADNDSQVYEAGSLYLAGAVRTIGDSTDTIVNTGTIIGSIALGSGTDNIENRGRIDGDIFLGTGDDSFLQQASATLMGTVDAGEGIDGLTIDATGGGAANGDQFVNFESFSQIGEGIVAYSGTFRFNTIVLGGGTITVAAGQTLGSDGPVTITGTDAAETVLNSGTIAESVELAGGNDRIVNNGTILGSALLGPGDDQFVEGPGSVVAGSIDGGEGSDLYSIILTGSRSGIGQRTGFERLGVEGNGTLTLTLDQDFSTVSLAGTGLNLSLAGHHVDVVNGTDAAETLTVDRDLALVDLGGGSDQLALGTTSAQGRYDGGAGNDVLRFTLTNPITLSGSATGFEQIVLAGNGLTVTGTLGASGGQSSFGDGDQQFTLDNGGVLAGLIDLGLGNDSFRLTAGGRINGVIAGGAGNDVATIDLAGNRTLADLLTGFETLAVEGAGTLSLAGTHHYDRITAVGDLAVLAGASLSTARIEFGPNDNRLTVSGHFTGSVDGGAGQDVIAVAGGSTATPVAFGSIANVESFAMSSGFATITGSAAIGGIDLAGGRLVGLGGSSISAPQIVVRQGATFGSAGIVNGNITVAGTLSPGTSPGSMTVNGNIALQSGSVSLFELSPSVSDKLIVNGQLSIASGTTLKLESSGTLRPGTFYDLIIASGGISGSYSTLLKPDSVFGFLVQRADRIQLLAQFLNDPLFSPQVSRSIAYANATLTVQPATSNLFAALPALLTAAGASNPAAFAQLTPEAYASASQIGVDNALTLSAATRSSAFEATGEDVRAYSFAQTLSAWHRLGADAGSGTSTARNRSYGFLGGVGVGNGSWSVGAFAGYLNSRQRIGALDVRTQADGIVAGIHARVLIGSGLGLTAAILYDGGDARTERTLPGGAAATGRYALHSWVGDLSVGYDIALSSEWTLRPRAGLTYVRTARGGVAETGGSPFALTVSRDRHVAGFADAELFIGRSEESQAVFRPFLSFGARYQIEGDQTAALAGYAGGGLGLAALGARRTSLVGHAAAGITYRLPSGLDLFATASSQIGSEDRQEAVTAGIRLRF
jgi:hypothetical protein